MSDWTGLLAQAEAVSHMISLTVRIVAAILASCWGAWGPAW